jgi:glycerol-3-phosphate acyltransferase PlsX
LRVILDAMGGDYAPEEIIKGAIEASEENKTEIVLVGNKTQIQSLMPAQSPLISIVHAPEVIRFDEHPTRAVRTKKHSSLVVGLNMLRNDPEAAFVSAGSTGAVVSASVFTLGKIKNLYRPALAVHLPTPARFSLLLDVGANADCKPAFLMNFAQMGKIYMEKIHNVLNPRIGLLTTGEEKSKGNRLARETHKLLDESGLNFIGNIEGKDIATGVVDIIITDGFTGNMAIKVVEGFGETLFDFFETILTTDVRFQEAAPLFKLALGKFAKKFDYSEHGGAPLLGVNGNVIVAHGRSNAKAVKNAIRLANRTAECRLVETIAMGFAEQGKSTDTDISKRLEAQSLATELDEG